MPQTELADHRRTPTRDLLAALEAKEPLALAEAYHRSALAGHGVATRMVGPNRPAEALLREVYADLWREPPEEAPLEGWVRDRTFLRGRDHLRATQTYAHAPSTSLLMRNGSVDPGEDRVERAITALDEAPLRALLLAHDRGTPSTDQRDPQADASLRAALLALAEADDVPGCDEELLGDLVLGLLDDETARPVAERIAAPGPCAELARALRRGRRRIEGLPPPPDLGHRIVAYVLATGGAVATPAPAADPPADASAEPERVHASGPGPAPASPLETVAPLPDQPSPAAEPPDAAELPDTDDEAPHSALDDLLGGLPSTGRDELRLSDLLGEAEPAPAGADERPPAPPWTDAPADPPTARAGGGEDTGAFGVVYEVGGRTVPPGEAVPAGEADDAPGGPEPDWLDTDDFPADEPYPEAPEEDGRRRRAATILLTIVGALLLLAAGGIAGLLIIRFVLG